MKPIRLVSMLLASLFLSLAAWAGPGASGGGGGERPDHHGDFEIVKGMRCVGERKVSHLEWRFCEVKAGDWRWMLIIDEEGEIVP